MNWNSCNPPDKGWYICAIVSPPGETKCGWTAVHEAFFDGLEWATTAKVVAWMPLPEFPTEAANVVAS